MSPGHMAHLERTIRTYVALVAKVQAAIVFGGLDGELFEPELGEAFACIREASELTGQQAEEKIKGTAGGLN